ARPARLVRRVRLDWSEWCEAVIRMGEQFLSDLEESSVPTPSRRAVRERLRALRHPSRLAPPRPAPPLGLRLGAAGRALVLQLTDGSSLLERAPRGNAAALGALLGSGRIWISGAPDVWQLKGPALLRLPPRPGVDAGQGDPSLVRRGRRSRAALARRVGSARGPLGDPWPAEEPAPGRARREVRGGSGAPPAP